MVASLISGVGLTKSFGSAGAPTRALDDVSVEIAAGEMLAIVGPSGSGKTTLLHCLSGIGVADRGTVTIGDAELGAMSDDDRCALRARDFGFVFQGLNLLPALSVVENVEIALLMVGRTGKEARVAALAALGRVGLADRSGAQVHELSGGEQQRVAVARAVAHGPKVVWADEPTGALDSAAGADVVALLREAVEEGRSVVVVTHSEQVAAAANRIIRLQDGRLA